PIDDDAGVDDVPGIPPVIGLAGNHFLAHYDFVFDGPARSVRIYAPGTTAADTSHAHTLSSDWLPKGFTTTDCMPMVHVGAPADRYPGLDLHANGKTIVACSTPGRTRRI
ncbi:MAG TPA: hypothetical protein VNU46_09700, partial [Gemmatimonadaceae bacterium]|nr:hypothetical protein [Gemmatimonadaceae bacterium]